MLLRTYLTHTVYNNTHSNSHGQEAQEAQEARILYKEMFLKNACSFVQYTRII